MATLAQMAETYDYMDQLFRLSLGETADITCALYDGDFTKMLEQAQDDKHAYIFEHLGVSPGFRLLDIGCGWGPVLNAIRKRGGRGVGLTLSPSHHASCRRNRFEVYLQDWKVAEPDTYGPFDGVASLGAFEHFSSVEEFFAGEQDGIYRAFFALCAALLPARGRLFLQTMIWGESAPPCEACTVDAPKGTNEYIVGVLKRFYPGSWLPVNVGQVEAAARPHFTIVSMKNGRRDYVETLTQWHRRLMAFSLPKLIETAKLVPKFLSSRDFRYKMESLLRHGGYMRQCLVRSVMDHQRIVLEKVG